MPYYKNQSGQYIKVGGLYAKDTECLCCEEDEVDCGTDFPTADFSYEQVTQGQNPCCFQMTDESTPGPKGGTIVGWKWYIEPSNIPVSFEQNPILCFVPHPLGDVRDVTLQVTDEHGCTDSVVMEVVCDRGPALCFPCTTPLASSCAACAGNINGTHTLYGQCLWKKEWPIPCNIGTPSKPELVTLQVGISTPGFGFFIVASVTQTGGGSAFNNSFSYIYRKTIQEGECKGTHILPFQTTSAPFVPHLCSPNGAFIAGVTPTVTVTLS
jgi:PKD repeat protein